MRIRDQLIQAPHIGGVQIGYAAIVVRAQQQQPSAAVSERGQFRRDAGFVALKLVAAVFG